MKWEIIIAPSSSEERVGGQIAAKLMGKKEEEEGHMEIEMSALSEREVAILGRGLHFVANKVHICKPDLYVCKIIF